MKNKTINKTYERLIAYGNAVVSKRDKKTQEKLDREEISKRPFHDIIKVGNARKEMPRGECSAFIYEATREQRALLELKLRSRREQK